jgi:hypothetical protein
VKAAAMGRTAPVRLVSGCADRGDSGIAGSGACGWTPLLPPTGPALVGPTACATFVGPTTAEEALVSAAPAGAAPAAAPFGLLTALSRGASAETVPAEGAPEDDAVTGAAAGKVAPAGVVPAEVVPTEVVMAGLVPAEVARCRVVRTAGAACVPLRQTREVKLISSGSALGAIRHQVPGSAMYRSCDCRSSVSRFPSMTGRVESHVTTPGGTR